LDKAYDRTPTRRSRELRKNATDAERLLWRHLRNRQLNGVRFNFQVPIGPFICDFVARTPKLIVEIDGGQHSFQAIQDARRTIFLEERGYRVIRFWNNDVLGNVEGVLSMIQEALVSAPPASREGKSRVAAKGRAWSKSSNMPSPDPSRKAGGEKQ
jgi:very-short-patch-repair endonuclease